MQLFLGKKYRNTGQASRRQLHAFPICATGFVTPVDHLILFVILTAITFFTRAIVAAKHDTLHCFIAEKD